jgi:LPXTG-site transpeptidase (sortase) family protein
MKKSGIFYIILGIILFGSLGLFATTLTRALGSDEEDKEVPEKTTQEIRARLEAASSTLPVSLSIPKINVETKVQHVGLSKKGTMAVPTNYVDVGWFKHGTIPGQEGTAVLAGHFDNGFGKEGVFKRLAELQTGDEVVVTDQKGKKLTFRVFDTATLPANTSDTAAVFESRGRPLLTLITCDGAWNAEKKSYEERKIVYAELIDVAD